VSDHSATGALACARPLPAIAESAYEVIGLLHRFPIPLAQLVTAIRQEPSLAFEVMRAGLGETGAPGPLEQTVVLLGAEALQALVMAVPLVSPENNGYREFAAVVQHSRLTALLTERIAGESGYPKELAYLAGLLHDIGYLAGAGSYHGGKQTEPAGCQDSLPDHFRVGGEMARRARLPEWLVDAIERLPPPVGGSAGGFLVRAVAAADQCAHALSHGLPPQQAKTGLAGGPDSRPESPAWPGRGLDELLRTCLPMLCAERRQVLANVLEYECRQWEARSALTSEDRPFAPRVRLPLYEDDSRPYRG